MFLIAGTGMTVVSATPADQVVLGVIGAGSRGTFVMTVFQKDPSLLTGAICDVYEPNLERGLSTAARTQGSQPTAYRNYKQLLADKNVQAVLIATPEHRQAQMVLDALAAVKDVYVEKPLCQTPEQGAKLVDSEKKTKNIIQVGMQRRSYDLYLEGRDLVASGQLGTVRLVRSWWLKNYLGDRKLAKLDGPLDWERWQGPAARLPMDPDRFRNWRFYSEYAGGILADQGAHVFDGIHSAAGGGVSFGRERCRRQASPRRGRYAGISGSYRRISGRLHRCLLCQLRRDAVQIAQRSIEPARWRSCADGYGTRRAQCVPEGIGGAAGDHQEIPQGLWLRDRSPCAELSQVYSNAKDSNCSHAGRIPEGVVVQMTNISLKHGRRYKWNAAAGKVEA